MTNPIVTAKKTLGLSGSITFAQVKQARKSLAWLNHPDCTFDDEGASNSMAAINSAADTLVKYICEIEESGKAEIRSSGIELANFDEPAAFSSAIKPLAEISPMDLVALPTKRVPFPTTPKEQATTERQFAVLETIAAKGYQSSQKFSNAKVRDNTINVLA